MARYDDQVYGDSTATYEDLERTLSVCALCAIVQEEDECGGRDYRISWEGEAQEMVEVPDTEAGVGVCRDCAEAVGMIPLTRAGAWLRRLAAIEDDDPFGEGDPGHHRELAAACERAAAAAAAV